ncbi:retrovirus-related pol polyprotein from transposon TNT 1-94 [Tanacetum coccineum]
MLLWKHEAKINPPYKFKWTEKTVPVAEGSSETTTEGYMENYKNVSKDIRNQLNAEAEAIQIILTGIDNNIYSTVDACPNACEMWKAIERFYKMMNELVRNQCDVTNHQVNVQFLLQLQPEWQRFVTLVKQSQELKTVSYHKLYDILKQHQNEVNEIRAERLARTANPLALVAQQQPVYHPQNHPTHNNQYSSSRSQQSTRNRGKAIVTSSAPTYDPEPATVTEDEEMSKEKEIDKLMALISLSFKKIYKPTNNNLRTSSNTSRANQDNSPRINRGTGYDNQRVVNVAGARENVGTQVVQKSGIQCYNCKEYGHVSRECQKPKRVKDAAYHKEKGMLFVNKRKLEVQMECRTSYVEGCFDDEWKFLRNDWKFGNDQIAPILGYGGLLRKLLQLNGFITLNGTFHNLSPLGQFCDADLEELVGSLHVTSVDLKGNDLLIGSRGIDLYSITLQDPHNSQTICLMAKAKSVFYVSSMVMASTVTEDDEMLKEKEIDKLMALISLSFKKIYKPTNNNLRTSSNTSRANQDNSLRINKGTGYDNKRVVNVARARENVDSLAKKDFSKSKPVTIQNVSNDFSKIVTAQILPQNMLPIVKNTNVIAPGMYKVHTKPNQTRTPQLHQDIRVKPTTVSFSTEDDTDDESDDQELEAHYMYMAQIQEVTPDPIDNSGPIFDAEPLHKLVDIILFIVDSGCSKHMTRNLKLLTNFVEKFLGTVKFGNDQIALIFSYGDPVQGTITIKRVYYVEGLNHNLFSVGQFCDADLEVAFRKSTCHIRDLKGNDLLTGSRGTDLYSITLQDLPNPNPICLMAKATSSQAWLWPRRLSHLNFDSINLFSKNNIMNGLPKLKFIKDHLCSSCELEKTKRKSFHTKTTPSSKRWLQLLHMDLCGPMRVESINGKKYVLVIVDDYSRYTWTHFLRSKDETPEVLIGFLTLIQRGLHAQVRIVRTDKGKKFLNKTLHAYFAKESIRHKTSTARTPEQNGVVER